MDRRSAHQIPAFNDKGSALMIVIIFSASVLIVMTAISQWLTHQLAMNTDMEYQARAYYVQSLLVSSIQDDTAWSITEQDPRNGSMFDCLKLNSCGSIPQKFVLVGRGGNVVLDSRNSSDGFNLQGVPCNNFDATNGNPDCPFHYDLTWVPDCTSCTPQSVQVSGSFLYNFGNKNVHIPKNLNFSLIRGTTMTLADNCRAMGGKVDDNNTERCVLPIIAPDCGNGQVMIGGNPSDGRQVCRALAAVNSPCPGGWAATNFGPQGEVQCVPLNSQ